MTAINDKYAIYPKIINNFETKFLIKLLILFDKQKHIFF